MRRTISTTVKPAQRMRRGVIMEHHLEFGTVPLQRSRNRGSRRGCKWNLSCIICLPQVAKSSIFVSCWMGKRRLNGARGRVDGEEGESNGKLCDPAGLGFI